MKSLTPILCLLFLLFTSCERRELTYETQEGAPFLITPDWSVLPENEDKPQYIKALFFPVNGGETVERYLSSEAEEVRVPPGEYRIIIYNWRTNTQTQTVQFRGETYDTFEAYIAPRSTTLRTRGERELHVIPQPDEQLYGWNTAEQTVVISATSPVVRTRTSTGNALTVPMRSMVRSYVMTIHVENVQYVGNISAMMTDAKGSLPFGSGSNGNERYAIETEIEQKESKNGITTYYCRATTFGLFDDTDKKLVVNITNTAGDEQQAEAEITQVIERVDTGEVPADTPLVVIPEDAPIIVETPASQEGGGFAPPSLDDWQENEVEIPLIFNS